MDNILVDISNYGSSGLFYQPLSQSSSSAEEDRARVLGRGGDDTYVGRCV